MNNATSISFYLRENRIHIFIEALRGIGCPKYVCFMVSENGRTLVMIPYKVKDFHSHHVPTSVYKGKKAMGISSKALCRVIASLYQWDLNYSYRVPGVIIEKQKIVMFYLDEAEKIEHDE